MVIGNGDIAKVLTDRDNITWFASGVSNSKEKDVRCYEREIKLLMCQDRQRHLVYFSSLCIYYADSEYARHKRVMEKAIRNHFTSFTIVRLGNIDWGTNPNTIINYFKAHPDAPAQEVYRHIIDLKEFTYWMDMIKPGVQNEMNLPGKMVWVPDLKQSLKTYYYEH